MPHETPPVVGVTATTKPGDPGPQVRLNRAYVDAIVSAGLVPLIVPPLPPDAIGPLLDGIAGLVLTGGEDVAPERYGAATHSASHTAHVERDETELALVYEARNRRLPTLAICRGLQVVNVALGGTLVQDIRSERPGALDHVAQGRRRERVHRVTAVADSLLAAAAGARDLRTNSSHHQSLARVADALHVTATSDDGIIEGAEPTDGWWMLGVQWHPEELIGTAEPWDRNLFAAFAATLKDRR